MNTETEGLILVLPEKVDPEREAVARAWRAGGGETAHLGRFWEPPPLDSAAVRLYGNDTFCLVLAQKLGLELVSPPDDLLLQLDASLLSRTVVGATLAECLVAPYPKFMKPMVPKLFSAAVYESRAELEAATEDLPSDTRVLRSDIVEFRAEARCFVLGGRAQTIACYEGAADPAQLQRATELVERLSAHLPQTCVVDVGLVQDRWAVVEANAAWGSGLNGCAPAKVIPCLIAACGPAQV